MKKAASLPKVKIKGESRGALICIDEIDRLRASCAELEKALGEVLEIMPMDREELETGPLRVEEMYKRETGKEPSANHDEFTEWCWSKVRRARATLAGAHMEMPPKREIKSTMEILQRLADGDRIVFSEDGEEAWFAGGDRAFVGNVIIEMRSKGYLKRMCDDEENYRGSGEYDTISEKGRATLQGQDNGR
ncbi:MAG: hypothetical protein CMN10_07020 [Roseobacter sp.]|nr:hypothetical protein [Roseobacter sp.]MBV48298.1 hypothetical protein [Roseobacter sp.]